MFIELAEALDCPICADGYGLVAFVGESDKRRVISGRLGCPICEVEFPISAGTIDFAESEQGPAASDPATGPAADTLGGSAAAMKVAALLGLGDGPGLVIMLGEGLGALAPAIARMADRVEVIAAVTPEDDARGWDLEDLAAGVDPVTSLGPRWPIRDRALDGLALRGPVDHVKAELTRCLKAGRRLVVLDPDPTGIETLTEGAFETLAADDETWVGLRT